MKKAKVTLKKPGATTLELRRWCIEQAIRWPSEREGMAGVYSGGGGYRAVADKILKWVTIAADTRA